jgi:putative hemolysin
MFTMGDYMGAVLFILVLVVLNGYFAAAEIALISARRAALSARAERGSAGARAAVRLLDDPSRLLATIQIGITLVGFLASATAAVSLSQPLAEWMRESGITWLGRGSAGIALFTVTLSISYLTLVLGELAPKRLGLQRAEAVAIVVARPITVLAIVVSPIVWLLARSTDMASLALGVKPGQGRPGVSEEEIKLLVTEQGTLLDEEKRMIHEIFELGDTVAREIMVPRVDMRLLEDDVTVREALPVFRTSGFSRLPVYHESPDSIVGIVLLKDLVEPAADGRLDEPVTAFSRPPVFVPETKGILALLSEMRARRNHLAIVVDEYGGTAGLATIEDIVEEIIGEVADEFDPDCRFVTTMGPDSWILDGRLPVEDAIDMGLPVLESDEYETIAGWMLVRLGHIPVPGEMVVESGVTFTVQAVRRRRIARLLVQRVPFAAEVTYLDRKGDPDEQ